MPPTALLFDLLTALLDSWSLWDRCAGSESAGRLWRMEYLRLTYGVGTYVPYEALVHDAAEVAGLDRRSAAMLVREWDSLQPWPDVSMTLARLPRSMPLGIVTNCSEQLASRAVARVEAAIGRRFDTVVSAERAGAYKPDPRPYRAALAQLGLASSTVLFVAGSPGDLRGATAVGMPVVWHNAIGLSRPADAPVPVAESRSLAHLLHAAGVGDGVRLVDGHEVALDALVALSRTTFRDTYAPNHPADQVQRYLDEALTSAQWQRVLGDAMQRTRVAVAPDGTLLAYFIWRPQSTPPDGRVGDRPCEIVRIYADEGAKGRGLGAAMVRDAARLTLAHGGDGLWLSVAQYNASAIGFYERMGLRTIGTTWFDFAGFREPDFVMGAPLHALQR
jgi:2-haloacid dehalogenase